MNKDNISDTSENRRANIIFNKAKTIIHNIDTLIALADSAQRIGFIDDAKMFVEKAKIIEPTDTIASASYKGVVALFAHARPRYLYKGIIGNYQLKLIFHTRWEGNEFVPDTIEISVENHDNVSVTALARFFPELWYIRVTSRGPQFLALFIKSNEEFNSQPLSKPIWPGETRSAKTCYSSKELVRNNTNISISKLFKSIVLGTDNCYYFNLIGFKESKGRKLVFDGYE